MFYNGKNWYLYKNQYLSSFSYSQTGCGIFSLAFLFSQLQLVAVNIFKMLPCIYP